MEQIIDYEENEMEFFRFENQFLLFLYQPGSLFTSSEGAVVGQRVDGESKSRQTNKQLE